MNLMSPALAEAVPNWRDMPTAMMIHCIMEGQVSPNAKIKHYLSSIPAETLAIMLDIPLEGNPSRVQMIAAIEGFCTSGRPVPTNFLNLCDRLSRDPSSVAAMREIAERRRDQVIRSKEVNRQNQRRFREKRAEERRRKRLQSMNISEAAGVPSSAWYMPLDVASFQPPVTEGNFGSQQPVPSPPSDDSLEHTTDTATSVSSLDEVCEKYFDFGVCGGIPASPDLMLNSCFGDNECA